MPKCRFYRLRAREPRRRARRAPHIPRPIAATAPSSAGAWSTPLRHGISMPVPPASCSASQRLTVDIAGSPQSASASLTVLVPSWPARGYKNRYSPRLVRDGSETANDRIESRSRFAGGESPARRPVAPAPSRKIPGDRRPYGWRGFCVDRARYAYRRGAAYVGRSEGAREHAQSQRHDQRQRPCRSPGELASINQVRACSAKFLSRRASPVSSSIRKKHGIAMPSACTSR